MAKVYPIAYTPYLQEAMIRKAVLLNQGVVEYGVRPEFKDGGKQINILTQQSLDSLSAPTHIASSATEATAQALSDLEIIMPAITITLGLSASDFDDIRRGAKSLQTVFPQVATRFGQEYQTYLISCIKGVFDTALSAHEYDVTETGDPSISFENIAMTKAHDTIGETGQDLNTIVVHSKVKAEMIVNDLVDYVDNANYSTPMLIKGTIPETNGMRVLVNDTLCSPTGTTYPCYLMGDKPLVVGLHGNMKTGENDKPGTGGGTTERFFHSTFGVAVQGVSYSGSYSTPPTTSDLETGGNYTLKWNTKNVKMMKLKVIAGV